MSIQPTTTSTPTTPTSTPSPSPAGQTIAPPVEGRKAEYGPAVLLMGEPGTGKTRSLITLMQCGLELFVLGTETRFRETLLDTITAMGLDRSKLHTKLISPARPSFATMASQAKLVNSMSYESLSEIKLMTGREQYSQFVELLNALSDFKDDETGRSWGAVDAWTPDLNRAFCFDSLSGLNIMAKDNMTGGKPTAHQGEWGVAMDQEERLINKFTSDVKVPFVLTAHVEPEVNPITGGTNVQVGALGRKLAPKIPRFFSEVILTHRKGNDYLWSTNQQNYILKKRVLPLSDDIKPDFKPLIDAWRARS